MVDVLANSPSDIRTACDAIEDARAIRSERPPRPHGWCSVERSVSSSGATG
jgi:hypothetical protein